MENLNFFSNSAIKNKAKNKKEISCLIKAVICCAKEGCDTKRKPARKAVTFFVYLLKNKKTITGTKEKTNWKTNLKMYSSLMFKKDESSVGRIVKLKQAL